MVSGTRELLLRGGREERSHRAMTRPLVKLMGDLQRYGDLMDSMLIYWDFIRWEIKLTGDGRLN
jgi:hypothetical protein